MIKLQIIKWENTVKLNAKRIEKKLNNITVKSFSCVDSTNNIAKKYAINGCNEGVIVIASEQTAGKGRLGRTFVSKRGGVYFSLVLRPQILPEETFYITVAASVAAAQAIESISGKKCEIKWVNDIYIKGKKVCGILTEGGMKADGSLEYAILGVGINLFMPKEDFPENLPLASSVFNKKNKILLKNRKKEQIIVQFVNRFFSMYQKLEEKAFISEYQQRSFLTGKKITYTKNKITYTAQVLGIDENANLIVKNGEKTDKLSHGEIQIVGMEQFLV